MQAIGQLLVSTLLLLPLLSVLAHNSEDHSPQISKRSVDDDSADDDVSWQASTPSEDDDVTEAKRFNEFVGKRKRVFPSAKRSAEYLEFLGKRFLPLPLRKRDLSDVIMAAGPVGRRSPFEFPSKRSWGGLRGSWERAREAEGDGILDLISALRARGVGRSAVHRGASPRGKRYAEWLGKRGGPIADQLLRDLVNKRISAMMRNRLQNSNNPEFIGRRENSDVNSPHGEDLSMRKRYTEFIGK